MSRDYSTLAGPIHYINRLYDSNGMSAILREPREKSSQYMNRFARLLPALTLPLIRYIEGYQPDMAVVCERGARPVGKAIEAVIEATGNTQLNSVPFRYFKISGKVKPGPTASHLHPLMDEIRLRNAERIVVIDDIALSGDTKRRFVQTCADAQAAPNVAWVTFAGTGADFTAWPSIGAVSIIPWLDNQDFIGVDYKTDPKTHMLHREVIASESAVQFASAIQEGAQELAPLLVQGE